MKALSNYRDALLKGSVSFAGARLFNRILNDAAQETGASFEDLKIQTYEVTRLESTEFSPDSSSQIIGRHRGSTVVDRTLIDARLAKAIKRLEFLSKDDEGS